MQPPGPRTDLLVHGCVALEYRVRLLRRAGWVSMLLFGIATGRSVATRLNGPTFPTSSMNSLRFILSTAHGIAPSSPAAAVTCPRAGWISMLLSIRHGTQCNHPAQGRTVAARGFFVSSASSPKKSPVLYLQHADTLNATVADQQLTFCWHAQCNGGRSTTCSAPATKSRVAQHEAIGKAAGACAPPGPRNTPRDA